MIKFTNNKIFKKAYNAASKIANTNKLQPILDYIHLAVYKNKLQIEATNLDIAINILLDVDVIDNDYFYTLISSKSGINNVDSFCIEPDQIRLYNDNIELHTLNHYADKLENYPVFSYDLYNTANKDIVIYNLYKALTSALNFTSNSKNYHILDCINIQCNADNNNDNITIAGTNGDMLQAIELNTNDNKFNINIDRLTIKKLLYALKELGLTDKPITLNIEGLDAVFTVISEGIRLDFRVKLSSDTYPRYKQLINKDHVNTIRTHNFKSFYKNIKELDKVSDPITKLLTYDFNNEHITKLICNNESGITTRAIDNTSSNIGDGSGKMLYFSSKYMLSILEGFRVYNPGTISIGFNGWTRLNIIYIDIGSTNIITMLCPIKHGIH